MSKVKIADQRYSSKALRRIMNLFPPLLVNRIKIIENDSEFKNLIVEIKYSWLNKNIQKAIFVIGLKMHLIYHCYIQVE